MSGNFGFITKNYIRQEIWNTKRLLEQDLLYFEVL